VNLYQLKLADCLDDSNILQETQEYAENTTELLNNYTDFETLVRNSQLKCGCTSVIDDYTTPDDNCQSVIYYIELLKRDITQNKSSHKFKNSVGATGQLSANNFCIDRLQVKFMGDNIEVEPQSKQKASTGIDFSVPNSSNIVLSINVLDEEKKLEKIDAVWKYLSGSFSTLDLLKHESGREYGWLSSSQESDGDACIIGYDNAGGCSYGLYQLAVKTGKFEAYKEYVNDNYRSYWGQYAEIFKDDDIESAKEANSKRECQSLALTVAFNKVCNDDKFIALSQRTIATQNYKPVYDKIINTFGQTSLFNDMEASEEEALKEMCYSLGVQHGKAWRIFQMALLNDYTDCSYQSQTSDFSPSTCNSVRMSDFPPMSGADATKLASMKSTANAISMTEFKNRLYAARKLYVSIVNAPGWGNMVKSNGRYEKEKILLSQKTKI
jgi:hypothetical protein